MWIEFEPFYKEIKFSQVNKLSIDSSLASFSSFLTFDDGDKNATRLQIFLFIKPKKKSFDVLTFHIRFELFLLSI